MCIFNRPVETVRGTRILVTQTLDGRQLTCYQNYVKLPKQQSQDNDGNAMILPFPIVSESKDKPIELVNLSICSTVLEDLDKAFPVLEPKSRLRRSKGRLMSSGRLDVVRVGSYSCSTALNLKELRDVDPKVFQLSDNVAKLLEEHYKEGFGFLVCKLRGGADEKQHPIGYIHATPKDGRLFVPTRHEHGVEGKDVDWDHYIYSVNSTDEKTAGPTPTELTLLLQKQLVEKDEVVVEPRLQPASPLNALPLQVVCPTTLRRRRIVGHAPNEDLRLAFQTSKDASDLPRPSTAARHVDTDDAVLPPSKHGSYIPPQKRNTEDNVRWSGVKKATLLPQYSSQVMR